MRKTEDWMRSHQTKEYPCTECGREMIDVEWVLRKGVCSICKLKREIMQETQK